MFGMLGVAGVLAWPHLSIPALFHVGNPALAHDTSLAVAATFVFFLLGFPLNLSHRVLSGYQQTQVVNYFMLGSSIVGLGAIVLATRLHLGLLGLTLTYSRSIIGPTLYLRLVHTLDTSEVRSRVVCRSAPPVPGDWTEDGSRQDVRSAFR